MKLIKHKAMFMIYLIIAMSFSILLIVPVKAQESVPHCCEKTKTGEYCLYTDVSDCDPAYQRFTATCDQTSYCEEGCCYSDDTGQCFKNAPKAKCNEIGGTWSNDPTCSISQCQKGCCTILDQCFFVTRTMCRREISKYPNVLMNFDESIQTEQECSDQCRSQELGACVYSDKSCEFTTRESCLEPRGEGKTGFHANMLCSNPELDTDCAKQQSTNCYDGKVYWFDSCGNRENIYMDNKELSYNRGYVSSPKCVAEPNDPDCGNCDYSQGTLCGEYKEVKPTHGDYICRDINCKKTTKSKASPETTGGPKKHGESWCYYDAAVGNGQDVVGSRHMRMKCENGEEIIEPCADFREEMCVQTVMGGEPTTDLGSILGLCEGCSQASCIPNRANPKSDDYDDCNACRFISNPEECCTDSRYRDCLWRNHFCSPQVPPGLRFWDPVAVESECSKADTSCKVTYFKKSGTGMTGGKDFKCVGENCKCLTKPWVQEQNRRCVAQGDCGAYYNIEMEPSVAGILVGGDKNLLKYGGWPFTERDLPDWEDIKYPPDLNKGSSKNFAAENNLIASAVVVAATIAGAFLTAVGTTVAVTTATTVVTLTGATAAGATAAGATAAGATAAGTSVISTILGFIVLPIAAVFLVLSIIDLAGVKKKTRTVIFKCMPWEASDIKGDCTKCNTGPVPCSEYRCRSLGKHCELVNIGTENELCVYRAPYDITPPVISSEQEDYAYEEKGNLGYKITDEIPINTKFEIAIKTNEYARCKLNEEYNIPYKDMNLLFETTDGLSHTIELNSNLPEEDKEEAFRLISGKEFELYAKCEDIAGNSNNKDYYIKFEVSKGPDLITPSIEDSNPKNDAYIAANLDKVDLSIYLNEPSSCRWSKSDVDYSAMSKLFTCIDGPKGEGVYYSLYECKTTLDIEKERVNNYFFRCEDKAGNINSESYTYTLKSTIPLEITSVEPSGKVYTSTPTLIVITSKGAEDGIAFCASSIKDDPIYNMVGFLETNSTIHRQQLALTSEIHKYYIDCIDRAGNIAESETTLDVEADITPPGITKAYIDAVKNVLVLETSEETTCEFASQEFTYGSGTSMLGTLTTQHKANLQDIYYVICKDEYDNELSVVIYP